VTEKEVEGIIDILSLKPGDTILDMPCGYGRHCSVFAKMGYKVTGVDLSDNMIKIARRHYSHGKNIKYVNGDMRNINLGKQFDACLNLYISFGFFQDNNENILVLKNVARHLKSKGKFVLELVNPFNATSNERKSGSRVEETDRYRIKIKKMIDPRTMWENYHLQITDKATGRKAKNIDIGYYLYTVPEISILAAEAGLALREFYGGGYHEFSRTEFTFDAARIIAVFEKRG
jgi:ubiquinone/menaquinone biosynthesis C-methylase UbiE